MTKEKNEWELQREAANKCWKSMTPHQQKTVLEMLEAWLPIRSSISELCSLDYDDLRTLDNKWYCLQSAIVGEGVELKHWH